MKENTLARKLRALLLTVVLLFALFGAALPQTGFGEEAQEIRIVFTSDMHSHEEQYAKLATVIRAERGANEATYVLDAGDFSMGTPYQTIYQEEAPELRLMGAMGYDAATLGNHEFDFRSKGLTRME